jgi:hypothetical protein
MHRTENDASNNSSLPRERLYFALSSDSYEISSLSQSPKVHYHTQKSPLPAGT